MPCGWCCRSSRAAVSPVGRFRVTPMLPLGPRAQGGRPRWPTPGASWPPAPAIRGGCGWTARWTRSAPRRAEDPLDCVPSATDEAAFDGRLAARRGLPVTGDAAALAAAASAPMAPAGPRWRPRSRACSPPPDPRRAPPRGDRPRRRQPAVRSFRLQSYFEVSPTTRPDRFQADHQLEALELGETAPIASTSWSLGLPLRTARLIPVTAAAARSPSSNTASPCGWARPPGWRWSRGSSPRRGYPGDIAAFVTALRQRPLRRPGHDLQGLPRPVGAGLPAGGRARRLHGQRLPGGGAALGRRLGAVFAGPSTEPGIDLFLEGTAPLIDREGDGLADSFGWLLPVLAASGSGPGTCAPATNSTRSSASSPPIAKVTAQALRSTAPIGALVSRAASAYETRMQQRLPPRRWSLPWLVLRRWRPHSGRPGRRPAPLSKSRPCRSRCPRRRCHPRWPKGQAGAADLRDHRGARPGGGCRANRLGACSWWKNAARSASFGARSWSRRRFWI